MTELSRKIIGMSLKLLVFVVFLGIAMQSFGSRTSRLTSAMGLGSLNVNSYIQRASSELSLGSGSLNLNGSTSDLKRYFSDNLREINKVFSTDLW